jgi:DNA repair protein RecN (Recombination protein N)
VLRELQIRDFALVDEVELEFEEGLNVLSGETGAGKSIIVGAMSLLLGGRASSDQVRTGAEEASIHGVFSVEEASPARAALEDLGIEVGEDGLVLISRTISRSGRNQCRVNGRPVTQAMLSSVGEHLVDIHGQHEHQSLLRVGRHIEFLDDFAGAEALGIREQVRSGYARLVELEERLASLRSGERERAQRMDLLEFQAREIDAARLSPGEDARLARERTVLAAADQLYAHANSAYAGLRGSDTGALGACDALAAAVSEIEAVLKVDDSLRGALELLQNALAASEEAARVIRMYRDGIELDPARLAEIEERLALLQRLRRKYGDTVDEILEFRRRIGEELQRASSSEEEMAEIADELTKLRVSLGGLCASLREARVRAARALERQVEVELADLNMGSATFRVSFSCKEDPRGVPVGDKLLAVGPGGADIVEFLFSANPGEPAKPLARIASGGEISRVMLALKSCLASVDEVGTLIFDEIDTGIGGRTATAVGEKLASTSLVRQVVCVTHLAQIACMADVHYGISKVEKGGRTLTMVEKLEGEARAAEIARMLGGAELTPTSIKHAKEMLLASRRPASAKGAPSRCAGGGRVLAT